MCIGGIKMEVFYFFKAIVYEAVLRYNSFDCRKTCDHSDVTIIQYNYAAVFR